LLLFAFILSVLSLPSYCRHNYSFEGFNDPSCQHSVLVVSKQHWPRITDRRSHIG
jgi:hypothetical protein